MYALYCPSDKNIIWFYILHYILYFRKNSGVKQLKQTADNPIIQVKSEQTYLLYVTYCEYVWVYYWINLFRDRKYCTEKPLVMLVLLRCRVPAQPINIQISLKISDDQLLDKCCNILIYQQNVFRCHLIIINCQCVYTCTSIE